MDGTTFRTADSPTNREHFGAQSYASGAVASYPQVRGVTLTAVPTHLVVDAAFGRYDTNEMLYAKMLVPGIPDHTLTVFDKGFLAAEILCGLTANGQNSTVRAERPRTDVRDFSVEQGRLGHIAGVRSHLDGDVSGKTL
jgi:hypothetical protein